LKNRVNGRKQEKTEDKFLDIFDFSIF